jgi:hypothetical protein
MQDEPSPKQLPYPRRTEDLEVEDLRFFIGGHGRSGTTWLERTLDSHPEILCLGPGMFFGKDIGSLGGRRVLYEVLAHADGLREWHDGLKNWRGEYLNPWTGPGGFEEDVAQITRAAIDALMRRALTRSGKRILGDRTPHHISRLGEINDLYPEAKVIHAIRDGRDVAISNMQLYWDSPEGSWHSPRAGSQASLSTEELEIRDAYREDREAFISSGQSIFTEEWIRKWAKLWNRVVRRGRKQGQRLFGDNYLDIFYEDNLHCPQEALEKLLHFLGTEACSGDTVERMVEENKFERIAGRPRGEEDSSSFHRRGVEGDWKEVFTEQDKRIFKEEAGDLLMELGYETSLDW